MSILNRLMRRSSIADVDMLEQLQATDDIVPPLYACLVILRKIS